MNHALLAALSLLSALLVLPAQQPERRAQKAFKGVELYSWKDGDGRWLFALLPGTNRLKAETEVKTKTNWIHGVPELEHRLNRLAEGEQVSWSHRDLKGFVYPDGRTMQDIVAAARRAKVDLHLPQSERVDHRSMPQRCVVGA